MFNSHEEVDSMVASNELKTRPAQPCESPFASAGGLTMHGIASGPKVSCSVVFSFKTPNACTHGLMNIFLRILQKCSKAFWLSLLKNLFEMYIIAEIVNCQPH